jgi:hypothetical protein
MTSPLEPTRRLTTRERRVFDRVSNEPEHLTQYAEAVARYEDALKSTKKHALISVPVVNRSTGNVTGTKQIRNPAFATLKESLSQANTLARRLLIDAHSAEKRQRLLTKRARAAAGKEALVASAFHDDDDLALYSMPQGYEEE